MFDQLTIFTLLISMSLFLLLNLVLDNLDEFTNHPPLIHNHILSEQSHLYTIDTIDMAQCIKIYYTNSSIIILSIELLSFFGLEILFIILHKLYYY